MKLQGYIRGSEDGWKFYGQFGRPGGPPLYKIEGGLDKPINEVFVPCAELINPRVGPFSYTGEIGPQYLNIRSTNGMPQVIITGKLAESIAPVSIAGWLQVAQAESE